jgi:K+-transporting ATPase KdpF subunit
MYACATTHENLGREDTAMTLDLWLAAIVALGLLFYLVAVLIRPERF